MIVSIDVKLNEVLKQGRRSPVAGKPTYPDNSNRCFLSNVSNASKELYLYLLNKREEKCAEPGHHRNRRPCARSCWRRMLRFSPNGRSMIMARCHEGIACRQLSCYCSCSSIPAYANTQRDIEGCCNRSFQAKYPRKSDSSKRENRE